MNMSQEAGCIRVFADISEMTAFLVRRWREIAADAVAHRGLFTAALSGGATPADFYRGLAGLKDCFPWNNTHIFPADERLVPFNDRDSNYGMMRELFLREVGIPEGNVHPVIHGPSPSAAAGRYEEELKRFFGLSGKEIPEFDFIGLGVGGDGHTASLFPEGPEVCEKERLAVSVERSGIKHARVSLTLAVINSAKNVFFIATGKSKAAIIKRVIEERDETLPAAMVAPAKGELLFVLDSGAASLLSEKLRTAYCLTSGS